MNRSNKRTHGVITVLVSLMLAGILSIGTLVLEAGRLQAAKTQINEANASAATSMLASYDSALYERYGLLAIDTELATQGRYRDYLEFNSDLAAGYKGNNLSTFYVVDSAEMTGTYNLTYPAVLKRQILSRAKYNVIPQDYFFNYYNMDHIMNDIKTKASYIASALGRVSAGGGVNGSKNDVPKDMTEALNNMYKTFTKLKKFDSNYNVTLDGGTKALLPSVTGTIEDAPFNDDVDVVNSTISNAQSVLGSSGSTLASSGGNTYNEVDATVDIKFITNVVNVISSENAVYSNSAYIAGTCRSLMQSINAAMNVLSADKEGNMLLNSYISGYFPCKNMKVDGYTGPAKGTGSISNGTFTSACVEYVLNGNASEKNNQQVAYNYVMAMRLVNNLYSVLTTSKYLKPDNRYSVAAHVVWAYYETWADAELLFRYNAVVPYSKYDAILNTNKAADVKKAFSSNKFEDAMKDLKILKSNGKFLVDGADDFNYRDALAMALWFVPNSDKLLRTADIIQLEMRYRETYVDGGSAKFLMSEQNTFCRAKCTGKVNSILPVISLDAGEAKGTKIQSIKYIGY